MAKFALNNNQPPKTSWAKPWEFLNFETFDTTAQENIGLFDVSLGLWQSSPREDDTATTNHYQLGVHVSSPVINKNDRQNVVITFVVDISGSMSSISYSPSGISRMSLVKQGLIQMWDNLKEGDVVNLVKFNYNSEEVVAGLPYQTTNTQTWSNAVDSLFSGGGTDLNTGIGAGYDLANQQFDANKANRVILMTDAYANTGAVDLETITSNVVINNSEGIYFSGLGYGYDFNEDYFNAITEAGKGAYFTIISPKDSERAFSDRFISLIQLAARDVRFKLEYPNILSHGTSAAEEVSTNESEVNSINFSYNTSQFFLEEFKASPLASLTNRTFRLTITYLDPTDYTRKMEVIEKEFSEILDNDVSNIKDALIVSSLPRLIKNEIPISEISYYTAELLADHVTPLSTEYRAFIQSYLTMKE